MGLGTRVAQDPARVATSHRTQLRATSLEPLFDFFGFLFPLHYHEQQLPSHRDSQCREDGRQTDVSFTKAYGPLMEKVVQLTLWLQI